MDDIEFFDYLYQGWTKTTGAETTFWMPEESLAVQSIGFFDPGDIDAWAIYAVDENQEKTLIGLTLKEEDAAWITALHGCFADLTRRLHQAVDEAERFECEKDQVISEMAEIAEENNELRARLEGRVVG